MKRVELTLVIVFMILFTAITIETFKVLGETKRNVSSVLGIKNTLTQANSKLVNSQQATSCYNTPSQNNTKKLNNLKTQLENALINNNNITSEALK